VARVLLIAYTKYIYDGRVKRHAEALADRGDRIDVICLDSGNNGLNNGVNIIGLKMPRYRGSSRSSYVRSYLRFFAIASWTALRLSLDKRYDVVIVCTMPDAAVLCAIPARLFGSRVVLDVHDTMPELYLDKFGGRRGAFGAKLLMLEERASAKFANRVIAVHALHRERLIEAGIPEQKIRTVMNSPDPAFHAQSEQRKRTDGRFRIVCHGTLTRRLGLDIAIEAVDLLRGRMPHLELMVIGLGDYLETAKELVKERKLENWVKFVDAVPNEQLPRLLAQADVGLVPNRASNATHLMLPVKLLDFTAMGMPAIAARLRTIEHYFGPQAVQFFEPGNPESLAAAIEELYLNPERRAELAQNARRAVERNGWTVQRAEYYDAIDSILPKPESPARCDPERAA
jgi:glycosyltransferase involved in cell wall biosynthesis